MSELRTFLEGGKCNGNGPRRGRRGKTAGSGTSKFRPPPAPHCADRAAYGRGGTRGDKLFNAVSRLKDCFEATIKYLGFVLLAEYFSSPACTAERSESLAEKMVRPSLGDWTAHGKGSQRVADPRRRKPGPSNSRLFHAKGPLAQTEPISRSAATSSSSTATMPLGHGVTRQDAGYRATWKSGCR